MNLLEYSSFHDAIIRSWGNLGLVFYYIAVCLTVLNLNLLSATVDRKTTTIIAFYGGYEYQHNGTIISEKVS